MGDAIFVKDNCGSLIKGDPAIGDPRHRSGVLKETKLFQDNKIGYFTDMLALENRIVSAMKSLSEVHCAISSSSLAKFFSSLAYFSWTSLTRCCNKKEINNIANKKQSRGWGESVN